MKGIDDEEVGRRVVDAAIKVHSALGPGLLESAYERCLAYELSKRGLKVERQLSIPLLYDGVEIEAGFRIDLLVDGQVVVEIKTVETLSDVHLAQVITYMKLGKFRLGYLLNFNVKLLRNGLRRVVNNSLT